MSVLCSSKTWCFLIDLKQYRICFRDLNPCDHWFGSEVEKVSNNDAHTSSRSLKSAIKRGFRSNNREYAVNAYKPFSYSASP